MANSIKIKVNGLTHGVTASLDTPLLYVLHNELHLHGPRFGCGLAQCGACSVLLDGKEIRSCVTPVAAVSGKNITTLEGLPALWAAQRGTSAAAPASASAAAGVDRRSGAALRLLPERDDDPGRRPARDDEEPVRGPDPHGNERAPLPLRHVSENPDRDPEGRGRDGKGGCITMTGLMHEKEFSRKSFVKAGGALVVGFSALGALGAGKAQGATGNTPFALRGPGDFLPDLNAVDSWIAVRADNSVIVTHGETELGHGTPTGILMLVAEEMNMNMDQMIYAHPETWLNATGGGGGSGGISSRSTQTRAAAAYAKQVLLGLASTKLGVPVANLSVSGGVVTGGSRQREVRRPARREAVQLRDAARCSQHLDNGDAAHSRARASRSPSASTASSASRSSGSTSRRRSTAPTPTSTTSASRTCSMLVRCGRVAQAPTPR